MSVLYGPHFTDDFAVGDRVRSVYSGNVGVVTTVVRGRCVWVRWSATEFRKAEKVQHLTADGLERL